MITKEKMDQEIRNKTLINCLHYWMKSKKLTPLGNITFDEQGGIMQRAYNRKGNRLYRIDQNANVSVWMGMKENRWKAQLKQSIY